MKKERKNEIKNDQKILKNNFKKWERKNVESNF